MRKPDSSVRGGGAYAGAAIALLLAAIAAGTLLPVDLPPEQNDPKLVWFGSLADALRNVVLFLPLGAAFAWRGLARGRGLALCFGVSLAIAKKWVGGSASPASWVSTVTSGSPSSPSTASAAPVKGTCPTIVTLSHWSATRS